jgi:anti-sigma regulatory factor (Ser/Thr protein kinase)
MGTLIDLTVEGNPHGAGIARQALRELEPDMPARAYAAIRLLVSELVANHSAHVGKGQEDSIHLSITTTEDGVRVEVRDLRAAEPLRDQSLAERERTGWDLILLDEMAEGWGVIHESKADVWFEVSYPDL